MASEGEEQTVPPTQVEPEDQQSQLLPHSPEAGASDVETPELVARRPSASKASVKAKAKAKSKPKAKAKGSVMKVMKAQTKQAAKSKKTEEKKTGKGKETKGKEKEKESKETTEKTNKNKAQKRKEEKAKAEEQKKKEAEKKRKAAEKKKEEQKKKKIEEQVLVVLTLGCFVKSGIQPECYLRVQTWDSTTVLYLRVQTWSWQCRFQMFLAVWLVWQLHLGLKLHVSVT